MKAVLVQTPGGLEALRYTEVPDPTPQPHEVVLKVHRCGVCYHDVVVRNGTLRAGVTLPCVLGHEVAGEVVARGAAAQQFALGQRVATTQRSYICGACRWCRNNQETLCQRRVFMGDVGLAGGYAEYVAVSQDCVAEIPDGVSWQHAAVAACALGTVLNALRDTGSVKAGETVLVTGAGGGLGLHGVQMARLAGARVIAQTSSPSKRAILQSLGAHEVVVHERGEDFSAQVRDLTQGEGVDVVLDTVGTPVYQPTRKSLGIGGRWLLVGQLTGDFVPFNPAQLFLKNQSMLSVTSTTRRQLQDVLQLLQRDQLQPVIAGELPLAQAAQAHAALEAGTTTGRLLLNPTL
jgi:acryloyl-coenzyme A reductase